MNQVFVSGTFNIVHPGHLRLLRYAKSLGKKLIVGVFSDTISKKENINNPYLSQELRIEAIKSITWVDEAFILNEPVEKYILRTKPEYVVKGNEFKNKDNIENEAVKTYGGKLLFSSGNITFSARNLINKEISINKSLIQLPLDFKKRRSINHEDITRIINDFSKLKVCVIGDLIVDEYIICEALGMSQEDPSIVVSPTERSKFIGGAGIVSAHGSSLGADVNFITVANKDASYDFAKKILNEYNVKASIFIDPLRPTTLKQRFRSKNKTLLRVSHLQQNNISNDIQDKIYNKFTEISKNLHLLIFSDFNYGCLPDKLIERIIIFAKKNEILIAADSQSSSQIGDIMRYKNIDLITPTEREARLGARNMTDGLAVLSKIIIDKTKVSNLILKVGEDGIFIKLNENKENSKSNTNEDKIQALNINPIDTAGAGDSLLIAAAMVLACKGNLWEASYLGSIIAAIQVGQVGNRPIDKDRLLKEIFA